MKIQIKQFDKKYLDEMAKVFVDSFSSQKYPIETEWAIRYISYNLEMSPDLCLMALDDNGVCLGAMFSREEPFFRGNSINLDFVLVKKEFRKKGVAKTLFKKVLELAKEKDLKIAHGLAEGGNKFPISWYKRLGFNESGWVEIELAL